MSKNTKNVFSRYTITNEWMNKVSFQMKAFIIFSIPFGLYYIKSDCVPPSQQFIVISLRNKYSSILPEEISTVTYES